MLFMNVPNTQRQRACLDIDENEWRTITSDTNHLGLDKNNESFFHVNMQQCDVGR